MSKPDLLVAARFALETLEGIFGPSGRVSEAGVPHPSIVLLRAAIAKAEEKVLLTLTHEQARALGRVAMEGLEDLGHRIHEEDKDSADDPEHQNAEVAIDKLYEAIKGAE